MPFIPHTTEDTKEMLNTIGADAIDTLFDEIPLSLQYNGFENMPSGLNEMDMLKDAHQLANKNQNGICFIGAGAYEHHIPAAVWDITSRGEFLTAYTPYQAEASQGTLQLLYEFQTMICELTGMDVANASMYDGATALAEAVLMAVRVNKRSKSNKILFAGSIHPLYQATVDTIVRTQNIELVLLPFDKLLGITDLNTLEQYNDQDITALVIAQPNFFGCLEHVDELIDWAHQHQIITVACVNPVSLAVLKPPSEWGAHGVDITCGEGQPLGCPMASGGPYFGFLSTRMHHVRQMPGRIIGKTVDKDGKPGFSLTLQAREQHIRRAKATSNICTNQGLLVTAATIHMSLLGAEGLRQVALQCHSNTQALVKRLTQIEGVECVFTSPYFHETLLKINYPINQLLIELSKEGIAGGYNLSAHFPELEGTLLICATEVRTTDEIEQYGQSLEKLLKSR